MKAIEGIILKTSSFEERSHLVTLFSKECGLIQIVTKSYSQKIQQSFSPLLKVEAQVALSDKELWKCTHIMTTASYQALRLNLEKLKIASYLLKKLQRILPPKQPVEYLYTLLDSHLFAMGEYRSPYSVGASFLLKLYEHEGVLREKQDPLLKTLLKAEVAELRDIDCSVEILREIAKEGT